MYTREPNARMIIMQNSAKKNSNPNTVGIYQTCQFNLEMDQTQTQWIMRISFIHKTHLIKPNKK